MHNLNQSVIQCCQRLLPPKGRRGVVQVVILAAMLSACSDKQVLTVAGNEVIQTTVGEMTGVQEQGIMVYKGIPYAAPPIEALRWKPPQAAQKWSGTRNMNSYGAPCMQTKAPWHKEHQFTDMSEDCLYMNVYTPIEAGDEPLPVMVWIHGGGFSWESASMPRYHGAGLVPQGVILVTFNYRLGPMGSFDYPGLNDGDEFRGNYVTMDQLAALHWVNDNIGAFGGDRNNITLFGESAGGWSVMTLLSAPLAKGLFHKAIVQSGTFNTMPSRDLTISKPDNPSLQAQGLYIAEQLGLKGEDIAEQLRNLPAEELLKIQLSPFGKMSYGPIADGKILPADPLKIWPEKIENPVPMIMGLTSLEGIMLSIMPQEIKDEFVNAYDPADLTELYGDLSPDELARHIWEDSLVYEPTRRYLRAAARQSPAVYNYHFDYVATLLSLFLDGAPHASELGYVFRTLPSEAENMPIPFFFFTDRDKKYSDMVSAYWVAFAKTGNPNGDGRPHWPRFTNDTEMTLELAKSPHLVQDLLKRRLDFYAGAFESKTIMSE
ncbi:MAG TPA: hypothetical protein DIW43_09460 [Spongiibacteraceae bacterium]|nr:hypothetical protein [Spongiibacteraceae bacterium]HCS27670.1 hypothetical protein [Spongiibacteraceae bacterium]